MLGNHRPTQAGGAELAVSVLVAVVVVELSGELVASNAS